MGVRRSWDAYQTEVFDIVILETTYEGILWVKFESKHDRYKSSILMCVCYLPPSASSRGDTSKEFFESLGAQIMLYKGMGMICVCGDFNAKMW